MTVVATNAKKRFESWQKYLTSRMGASQMARKKKAVRS